MSWVTSENPKAATRDDDEEPVSVDDYQKEKVWTLIDSYFEDNRGLQSQAIASFNRFVKETVPAIISRCGKVVVEDQHNLLHKTRHYVEFISVYLERQIIQHSADGRVYPLFPHEARTRNLTYSTPLSVDIRHTIKSVDAAGFETTLKETTHQKVLIAQIPVMLKSEFCQLNGKSDRELAAIYEDPTDPGGYFIINGKEKVIVTQERPANNKLFLFKPMCDSKYQYECEIRSTVDSATDKVSALWIHIPGNPKSYKTFKDAKGAIRIPQGAAGGSSRSKNRSLVSDAGRRIVQKQFLKNRPGLIVTIATVRGTVPLKILFQAMGFVTDEEIYDTFLTNPEDVDFHEAMWTTMNNAEARKIKTEEEALAYLGNKCTKEAVSLEEAAHHGRLLISEEVLPGLGDEEECDRLKGYHLGYMVNRLIYAYLGRIHCDDRDHLQNKRFDLAGPMLATLFKNQIKSLMSETRLAITRRLDNGLDYDLEKNIIRQRLVTQGIIYSMMSGNWGDKRRGAQGRVGVSQLLNRLTGIATLSYLRRINSPTNRLVRMTAPRQVHTTGFGYICPADTPEGETVGLLKALSVMAEVSTSVDKAPIIECLKGIGFDAMEDGTCNLSKDIKILIDAEIMGTCPRSKADYLVTKLKERRREYDEIEDSKKKLERLKNPEYSGDYRGISNQLSIVYDSEYREIRIRTDAGRAFRPLLVVKNNQLVLRQKHIRLLKESKTYNWKNLIKDGVIEFLDPAESESAMIAMFPGDLDGSSGRHMTHISKHVSKPLAYKVTFTHCEIHPSMILGVCASLIPYPDHNQSPRNTYQSGMAKQAIGVYQTNFYYRGDTEAHVLHYPQRPLVTTKTAKFIKYDDNPAGINTIAAIACYSGYNQEDSVILNKTAVQRGLFRSSFYRVKTDEAKVWRGRGDMDETFEIPRRGEVTTFRNTDYMHLGSDGLPEAGISIRDNEPLIGKTQLISMDKKNLMENANGPRRLDKNDISTMFRNASANCPSYVDSVILTDTSEGYRMVRVKTRTPRIPQIGDKFASRHGQKGVVGMDFEEIDLPFTKDGIIPDLILNPHAIPSRMTIGHLLETVESKRSALVGTIADGTAFSPRNTVEEIGELLESYGYHKHGMEVMYNGATGRKILNQIFIGPVFYQRLKHMTEDKIHIRCRGPVTELCKQPNAGLQKDGGLRFGEMERDSTITHGAASFLRERLFIVSDYYTLPICNKCGNFLARKPKSTPEDYVLHLKCKFCKNASAEAATIELPYACKLFFQELMSMNIKVMVEPENTDRLLKSEKKPEVVPDLGPNVLSALMKKIDD